MKAVNSDHYADRDVLREFSPQMLVAVGWYRLFLASKGVDRRTPAEIQTVNVEAVQDYAALDSNR